MEPLDKKLVKLLGQGSNRRFCPWLLSRRKTGKTDDYKVNGRGYKVEIGGLKVECRGKEKKEQQAREGGVPPI